MAYSCVRVQFEVGHEASIRNKRTPDGFTHDWEVFVRGADSAEIHHFVDKVVFHLHDTFPKPKRIIKEPPYVVKESGYAGFNLPIDIYVKSKEEGVRKIRLYYDLTLQPLGTGSARISNVTREKHDFTNPTEDLRRRLIRGGGCGVGSDGIATDKISSGSTNNSVSNSLNSSSNHIDESKNSPHSTSRGKGSGEPPAKKHKAAKEPKSEESRLTNSFAELFGTPIKTVKHSPNPKPQQKPASEPKSHEKSKESGKVPKHSPAKEKDKEKSDKDRDRREKDTEKSSSKEKERSKDKDGHKDGEKSKDKSRKSGSSSSSLFSQKEFVKKDDDRKKVEESVKEKEKTSSKGETSKSEKKHEDKKNREEKEKKDKHKKEVVEKKEVKEVEKEKPVEKRELVKEVVKESKEVGKHKEKEEKKSKSAEKSKDKNSSETEKPKHKHKKKDKHRKDEEREKPRKKDKEKEVVGSSAPEVPKVGKEKPPLIVKEKSPPSSPVPAPPTAVGKSAHPLKELLGELSDQGSDTDFSGSEDVVKTEVKEKSPTPPPAPPPPPPVVKIKEEKKVEAPSKEERPEKSKKKDRKSRDEEYNRKRKKKHKDRDSSRDEPSDKQSKLTTEVTIKDEKMSPSLSTESRHSRSPSPEETLFTEEYINQLKDLQQKIMTLQDNADLQKVVQVISETGQFEITQRTFDFDLCALDPSTVKMLQDMFISA